MHSPRENESRRFAQGCLVGILVSFVLWALILGIAWVIYTQTWAVTPQ